MAPSAAAHAAAGGGAFSELVYSYQSDEDEEHAQRRGCGGAAPARGEGEGEDDGALGFDVWCIAQGVAAAVQGALDMAPPDVSCLGAQPRSPRGGVGVGVGGSGAGGAQPARLELRRRGCALVSGCAAPGGPLACASGARADGPGTLRPEPPPGWEYCGPEDDDLRCAPGRTARQMAPL
jgi:hypothetical protein